MARRERVPRAVWRFHQKIARRPPVKPRRTSGTSTSWTWPASGTSTTSTRRARARSRAEIGWKFGGRISSRRASRAFSLSTLVARPATAVRRGFRTGVNYEGLRDPPSYREYLERPDTDSESDAEDDPELLSKEKEAAKCVANFEAEELAADDA